MSSTRQHPTITHLKISSSGTVVNTNTGRQLKGSKGKVKVSSAVLPIKNLVWETFVGPIEKGRAVYFKDFDSQNFTLDNLVCWTEEDFRAFNVKCLEEQGWRAHPKHNWYVADCEGTVMHAINRNVLEGHPQDGYIVLLLSIKGVVSQIMKQAFVMECFAGLYNRTTHETNHINGIRNDNRRSNLELLTIKEHGETAKNFPSKTRGISNQRPIICTNTGVSFVSITEAARSIRPDNPKTAGKGIAKVLRGDRKAYGGLGWKYEQDEDLGGEVWKQITTDPMFDSIHASSRGRIKLKTGKIVEGAMHGETRVTITNSKA